MRNWKNLKKGMFRMMTHLSEQNHISQGFGLAFNREPYHIVNFALATIIALVFIYSAVYTPDRNDYPVVCIHEKITGQQCVSCGLSHSFSLIVRGRISEALDWNSYGIRVFLFFALQLIMRVVCSANYSRNPGTGKELIILDASVSAVMFLITFIPFIRSFFYFL